MKFVVFCIIAYFIAINQFTKVFDGTKHIDNILKLYDDIVWHFLSYRRSPVQFTRRTFFSPCVISTKFVCVRTDWTQYLYNFLEACFRFTSKRYASYALLLMCKNWCLFILIRCIWTELSSLFFQLYCFEPSIQFKIFKCVSIETQYLKTFNFVFKTLLRVFLCDNT